MILRIAGLSRLSALFCLTILALAASIAPASAGTLKLLDIHATPLTVRPNLVSDGGFEADADPGAGGAPAGWAFGLSNAVARCEISRTRPHSGRQCLMMSDETIFGPNLYGTLSRREAVPLQVGRPYTLSVWARSTDPGEAWIGGGHDWQWRLPITPTGDTWRRFKMTFTPGKDDRLFTVRFNTDSPTRGVYFDDVKLEEGETATPIAAEGLCTIEAEKEPLVIEGDGRFRLAFDLWMDRAWSGDVAVRLLDRVVRRHISLGRGGWRLEIVGTATGVTDRPVPLRCSLDPNPFATGFGTRTVQFYSAGNARTRLALLNRRLPEFRRRIAALRASGQDPAYPLVTLTVIENFVRYALEDASRGEVRRSLRQTDDMEEMAARLDSQLTRAARPGHHLPSVPRWAPRPASVPNDPHHVMPGPPSPVLGGGGIRGAKGAGPRVGGGGVSGPSFLAPTKTATARVSHLRPVFFTGYGAFGQVRADIEKFPNYGVNIVQIETGPNSTFPKEGVVNDAPARDLLSVLNRAQKAGVAVNLLISPHYFPDWMLDKYPELRKKREGFIGYCIHAPEARELLQRFVRTLLPSIKDHPALHSICLSNEPVNLEEPCAYAADEWHGWLAHRHGDLATLNSRWGTAYASFGDIPLPDPFNSIAPEARRLDFLRFNQEEFAGFHKMLADAVHSVAPDLPVHAKPMTFTLTNAGAARLGCDVTLFGRLSQINGNDSSNIYQQGMGEFAQGWQDNALSHDLQRSVLDAPVFNSENHIIPDRNTDIIPPEHIRSALWQAAIHGQGATTIWVWERAYDPKADAYGSIMHRPACAEAVGIVGHDLNRAALEVTALQAAKPDVAILTGISPAAWEPDRIDRCTWPLYTALDFTGLKIGFLTERQLESGVVTPARVLFVPDFVHLSEQAMETLRNSYHGKIVFVGAEDLLSRDDYDHPRAPLPHSGHVPFDNKKDGWRELWKALLPGLAEWDLRPAVELTASGAPVSGVEWRSAALGAGRVVNVCNYLTRRVTCGLAVHGRSVAATDVLTGERLTGPFVLKPLETRLLFISQAVVKKR
jgi:hypothetical protein